MNKYRWLLVLVLAGIFVWVPDQGYAMYGDSATLPWSAPLVKLRNELGGPIAKMMAVVAVTMTGIMLMFGHANGMAKRGIQLVFGISLAVSAIGSDGLIAKIIVGDYSLGAASSTALTPPSLTDDKFLDKFITYIITLCMNGAIAIHAYVFNLLILLAMIDVVMQLILNFEKQDPIPFVFKETLRIGFFIFILQDWMIGGIIFDQGGAARVLFSSFAKLGLIAGGAGTTAVDYDTAMSVFSTSRISDAIINLVTNAIVSISGLGIGSIGTLLVTLVCVAGIVFAGFKIAIEIFLAVVEFWIISLVAMPLVGFGLLSHTKFLFEKAVGALFSQAVKIMVVMFIYEFSSEMFVKAADSVVINGKVEVPALINLLLGILTVWIIVSKVPDLAQGLLSGQPSLGGSSVMSSMQDTARTATGSYRTVMGVKNPVTGAREGGLVSRASSVVSGGIAAAAGGAGVAKALMTGGADKVARNAMNMGVGMGKGLYDTVGSSIKGRANQVGDFVAGSYETGKNMANAARTKGEGITGAGSSAFAEQYAKNVSNNAKNQ